MLYRFTIVVVYLLMGISIARASDLMAGQPVFRLCAPCHEVGASAEHRVGPQLNGLEGRRAGTTPGYPYSPAIKHSGIIWSERVFKEYLKNPKAMIPGGKMRFTGLSEEAALTEIWSFLKQFGPDGIPIAPAGHDGRKPTFDGKP